MASRYVCVCVCVCMICVVQSLPRQRYSDSLLALYGRYAEVFILDSETLEVNECVNGCCVV